MHIRIITCYDNYGNEYLKTVFLLVTRCDAPHLNVQVSALICLCKVSNVMHCPAIASVAAFLRLLMGSRSNLHVTHIPDPLSEHRHT